VIDGRNPWLGPLRRNPATFGARGTVMRSGLVSTHRVAWAISLSRADRWITELLLCAGEMVTIGAGG
jgi:hypothetical protein